MLKTYSKLFQNTIRTISNWKVEKRPIITLLEKYFTKEDLEEFLETGKISRLENDVGYSHDIDLTKSIMIDNAIYSAKEKLRNLNFDFIYNKGAIDILKEIVASVETDELDLENAKDVLFTLIKGYDAHWISLKNPMKKKLLSSYIENLFSKAECYAICKHSEEVFNFKGWFK